MAKKCVSNKAEDQHPLHAEIEVVLKGYENLFLAAQKKYADRNVISSTVLGVHVSIGSMLINSLTEMMMKADRKGKKHGGK